MFFLCFAFQLKAMKSVPPVNFYDTMLNEHLDILDGLDLDDSVSWRKT